MALKRCSDMEAISAAWRLPLRFGNPETTMYASPIVSTLYTSYSSMIVSNVVYKALSSATYTEHTHASVNTERTHASVNTERTHASVNTERTHVSVNTEHTHASVKIRTPTNASAANTPTHM